MGKLIKQKGITKDRKNMGLRMRVLLEKRCWEERQREQRRAELVIGAKLMSAPRYSRKRGEAGEESSRPHALLEHFKDTIQISGAEVTRQKIAMSPRNRVL